MVAGESSSIDTSSSTDGCEYRSGHSDRSVDSDSIEYVNFFETSSPPTASESSSGSTTLQCSRCNSFEYCQLCQFDSIFTWWTNQSKPIDNWTIQNESSNIFRRSSMSTIRHLFPFPRAPTPAHASTSISIHGDFSRNESIDSIDRRWLGQING